MDLIIVDSFISGFALMFASSWFVIALTIATIVIGVALECVEDGEGIWVVTVPLLLTIWAAAGLQGFTWPFYHPAETFAFSLQYGLLGVVYSFFRWTHLNMKQAARIQQQMETLQDCFRNRSEETPDITFNEWLIRTDWIPQISSSKMRVARWIVWWPISLVAFFFSDLIVNFINWVSETAYILFGNVFRRIQVWILSQYGLDENKLNDTTRNEKK